ncbi:discoidin domain-containing protein [Microaerobacter geothermalis]|uniref:discoidin domain-containing protein n=1 Tax=Microaerobacter geothermalis TaxID=674972 RepID=UPI001F285812|nr:discoidin domain-containing protein [Microaerobacter geothermalis]MCF6094153.1 discoidin domain-containing protein [Microaerobacter geothermalis]
MKKNLWIILIAAIVIASYLASLSMFSQSSLGQLNVEGIRFSFKDGKTVVNFTTDQPGFCQVLIGTESGKYQRVAVESMPEGPHREHYNVIDGLEPNTSYFYRINFSTSDGRISQSKENRFVTSEDIISNIENKQVEKPNGINIANIKNGGKILGVSSNYGNVSNDQQWGANMAIDGNPATEWSSAGDGDDAWINIGFDNEYKVKAFGFWTRTMGSSAEINRFRVLDADGVELGVFSLKGAEQIQYFSLDKPATTNSLRFEVLDSTGGNTGAVEIEVYPEK